MTHPLKPGDSPDDTRLADVETRLSPSSGSRPSEDSSGRKSGWLSSSGSIDHGRFEPGTILGGRYRIVGRLGKGGMGEVYRADDLKIGQQVALKFLPPEVDRDPARLTQLHTEVRMARQVSHPNVCRVYDIDEEEGHTFLSMEYVDGEDLSSLLRRIGHFPEARGLEIGRQICAGLAAAHERGVIHRDLKPANVMLDANGRVRINDFGLAGVAGEALRAGTPAYMAPEQLAGQDVTVRSDIYALGLVLYELFTGRRALEGSSLAEIISRRERGEIQPPSVVIGGLSPEIDRAVMRSLEIDPARRPATALAVAAALPGGDPLAAAMAAGETPSPEMVAAAGEQGVLRRLPGLLLLGFTVAGLLGLALLANRSLLVNRVSFTKSADVLAERARDVLVTAGHTDTPADTASGVAVNMEYVRWRARTGPADARWDTLGDGTAPLLDFWYRTSPQPLSPLSTAWTPTWFDPPLETFGMTKVMVDDRGRLLEYVWVPPQFEASPATSTAGWAELFDAAGLDFAQFSATTPQWTPLVYAEERLAWEGPMPQRPEVQLRVEAASYGGRPASFKVVGPWTEPSRMGEAPPSLSQRTVAVLGSLLVLLLILGAGLLVRANLKAGRADRRGANRIVLFLLAVWTVAWALGARHSFQVDQEMNRFFTAVAFALLNVGFTWLFYLALEPFVRRLSPDLLIGWARLLGGQVRDPRVGRDVLVGVATGVLFALIAASETLIAVITGTAAASQPQSSSMGYFMGTRYALSGLLRVIPNALQGAMLGAFLYVVVLALVRRQWAAWAVVLLVLGGVIFAEEGASGVWVPLVFAVMLGTVILGVFVRFGLLALAMALFVNQALQSVPLTLDLAQPHAAVSMLALGGVAALALGALYTSRAAEGTFRRLLAHT